MMRSSLSFVDRSMDLNNLIKKEKKNLQTLATWILDITYSPSLIIYLYIYIIVYYIN